MGGGGVEENTRKLLYSFSNAPLRVSGAALLPGAVIKQSLVSQCWITQTSASEPQEETSPASISILPIEINFYYYPTGCKIINLYSCKAFIRGVLLQQQ